MTRVFTAQELSVGCEVTLEASSSHHLSQVLRAREQDPLILFNGDGNDYIARIAQTGKKARIEILSVAANPAESPFEIHLLQGISRGDRMDASIQKSVELGVSSIHALFTQKSKLKLDSKRLQKKLEHWRAIVISACEQCGRSVIPPLHVSSKFEEAILSSQDISTPVAKTTQTRNQNPIQTHACNPDLANTARVMLLPGAKTAVNQLPAQTSRCLLLVGAESGFTDAEINFAQKNEFAAVAMGPRILRTETAGPAAISVLQARFGDLGGSTQPVK